MKYKYLLNFWWAKDIPEVLEENVKITTDQLVFKYFKYPIPHQLLDTMMQEKFLDDYDYIIFTSPDLVVKQNNIDQLIHDIETTDAKVMGGVCNVDMGESKNKIGSCMIPVISHKYNWVEKGEFSGIHEVQFNGFVLLAFHKSVIQDYKFYEGTLDFPIDLRMCQHCIAKKIPIMTNFDNYMLHLRYHGKLMAGVRQAEIWFKGRQVKIDETPNMPILPTPISYV
jgi:hypothetical protein